MLYIPKDDLNELHFSRLQVKGMDNVTLRLWTFSDFCSRHTVGVAGDDIMFHILVDKLFAMKVKNFK